MQVALPECLFEHFLSNRSDSQKCPNKTSANETDRIGVTPYNLLQALRLTPASMLKLLGAMNIAVMDIDVHHR